MTRPDEEFDVEAPPPAATSPPQPARPARSAVGFFLLGLVLVAIGVVLAPTAEPDERGLVASLESEPQLQWHLPIQAGGSSDGHVWLGENRVVAASPTLVRSVDLRGGDVVWEVRAPQMQCGREEDDIACVSRQGARSELIEMTMASGETGRTVQPGLEAALPHDRGHITLYSDTEAISVMRSGDSGEHRWTHRVPGAPEADLGAVSMAVLDDLVLIQAPRVADGAGLDLALDLADGTPHEETEAVSVSHDGEWLVRRENEVTLYDRSGRPTTVSAESGLLRVDDDPGSDLVFSDSTGDLRALSAATGEQTWSFSTEESGAIAHARLAGTMVGWSGGSWYGLDAEEGTLRWTRPGQMPRCPCLGADTTLAHVTGEDVSVLTGFDTRTGAVTWEIPLAESRHFSYDVNESHLAVFTAFDLSVWSLEST
ncbi:PQQ-binding-like beta-propeller repeat protein [Pseudactinotalea sp. Z1748]|uniref:outer membrane protein assembly factor BamB family protein n=1 Tax=Pseudactinotalea sp. Z1748 TaxID=3413027 RepID=UPI003C7E49ED